MQKMLQQSRLIHARFKIAAQRCELKKFRKKMRVKQEMRITTVQHGRWPRALLTIGKWQTHP